MLIYFNNYNNSNQSMTKKKKINDEIDFFKLITILWTSKWKIFFITLTFTIAGIINFKVNPNYQPKPILFSAETIINPISTFDEFKYEAYNSYLRSIEKKNINLEKIFDINDYVRELVKKEIYQEERFLSDLKLDGDLSFQEFKISEDANIFKTFKNNSFNKINKKLLYDLFVDKLNENYLIIDGIKKFDLVKKQDYSDASDYENAIIKLASLIKIVNINSEKSNANLVKIKFQTYNIENWKKFLNFLEVWANSEVQAHLKKYFETLITNEIKFRKYQVEDIEFELSNNKDINVEKELNNIRLKYQKANDISRLRKVFNQTPIMVPGEFIAAKINVHSTSFKNLNKVATKSLATVLSGFIVFGIIFSVLYVLILNIKQRNKKKV